MKKNIFKRLTSMVLVVAFAMMCSTFAFADEAVLEENSTEMPTVFDDVIIPRASDMVLEMWVREQSRTSQIEQGFNVIGTGKCRMWMQLTTDGPCVLYVGLKDSSGKVLGYSTMDMKYATTASFNLNPSTLNAGSYKVFFWFDRAGVTYDLFLYQTSPV